ncbi:hypothetical protein Pmani_016489 [Petrolisthes manimaculis]|uniref:C-type lectin domain-containing protein n=1 Tax=Petrolisthes manimaculis TaxID=1843537 RepID=A0AAE1PNU0_9EUCA|nr:hypothetical protein Pmani_016489 [Petrolisthes manimaculis]
MISPTLVLFFLALGCVLSQQPHAPTTITNNGTTTTTTTNTQVTVNLEDLHTSIVVNQLAILKHIKDTSARLDGQESVSVLHDEVRRLQTNLASMHGDIVATLRGITATGNLPLPPQSTPNININCPDNGSHNLVELKELMLQLLSQNNQSQEIKQELMELKEFIVEEVNQIFAIPKNDYCIDEGKLYVNNNCSISVCQRNVLLPYQGSTAPNVDFSDLLAKYCVHLDKTHKTWEEARANCISLGGDLFVAGDYEGAREYLKKEGLSVWPWVGVKGKSWLDGQQVTDDEWDDDSPGTDDDSCSFLHGRGLEDSLSCSKGFSSLCVMGTNYQSHQLDQVTEDSQCTVEGKYYVNDNCSISVCQHNVLLLYQGSTAPNVNFSDLLAKDCVHLDRSSKTWEAARANCRNLGGDLFVAGDYEGAREYLKKEHESDEGLRYWPWVGVTGKSWLDGQQVTDDEWDDDSPGTDVDTCSFLHGRGLEDVSACSSSFTSLCVNGSYYW